MPHTSKSFSHSINTGLIATMTFLNLPNEILAQIRDHVDRDDIENFAACNKLLYALSEQALILHSSRKKHSIVSLCPVLGDVWETAMPDRFFSDHPFQFLKKLLDDDRGEGLASYVKALRVSAGEIATKFNGHDDSGFDIYDWDYVSAGGTIDHQFHDNGKNNFERSDQLYIKLKAAIVPYRDRIESIFDALNLEKPDSTINLEMYDDDISTTCSWPLLVMDGHAGATIGLIIAMLPNLMEITISCYPDGYTRLVDMIQHNYRTLKGLQKLQHVEVSGCSSKAFTIFATLASMPTVRTVSGKYLKESRTPLNRTVARPCRYQTRTRPIEKIDLEACSLRNYNMRELCGLPNSLVSFRLVLDDFSEREPSFRCRRRIINWLKQTASDTLTYLELACLDDIHYHGEDRDGYLGSLRNFQKLKTLKVPCRAFEPRSTKDDPESISIHGPLYFRPQYLVDVLPASLETLTLTYSKYCADHLNQDYIFHGMSDLKDKHLPNFREIGFRYWKSLPGEHVLLDLKN